MKMMLIKHFFYSFMCCFVLLFLFTCSGKKRHSKDIVVFKNDSSLTGYGYDIVVNGKVYVHQPNIPAVAGNNGFSTEDDAFKTGELVLYKIQHNILPPSVEVRELDSIGVIK